MIQIAIVEDDPSYRELLKTYVTRYFQSQGDTVSVLLYPDGADFLQAFPGAVDLILLDIDMPKLNGLETARKIRTFNDHVLLIFVTNLVQCALEGYAVDAMDFIIKPVTEASCRQSLSRVRKRLMQQTDHHIQVSCQKNTLVVSVHDILYAETQNHSLLLHCHSGDLVISESMQTLEKKVAGFPFFRCHNSYLIHLAAIDRLGKTDLHIGDHLIPVSKYRRPELLKAIAAYMGGMS
jgi:DNA-binding LytR/AlgR family response regulator